MSTLALAAPPLLAASPPKGVPTREHLWLCIHLPDLALQARSWAPGAAGAVIRESAGQHVIHAVNDMAARQGVMAGMSLPTAYAVCPSLQVQARDGRIEARRRRAVARESLAFTDWVSLDRPDAVLLEVGGSLRLFGGLDALRSRLRQMLARLGLEACMALAPVPLAAWMLARSGQTVCVLQPAALRSALGELPLSALPISYHSMQRLSPLGVRTLRDLWRLPRDALARRYGRALVHLLEEALGESPCLEGRYRPPTRFCRRIDLIHESDRLEVLVPMLDALMEALGRFLIERAAATSRIRLRLFHRRAAASTLTLQLSEPIQDWRHGLRLLRGKLERAPLSAPVMALELTSADLHPHRPAATDLFDGHAARQLDWSPLLDELRNRLGEDALRILVLAEDHRPERALCSRADRRANSPPAAPRPVWLLPAPAPAAAPQWRLLSSAERIESGWWDPPAVQRDYYQALDREGRLLWVFRDGRQERWYVQGIFA
ncbi:MAG TPA: DNA polymerase Y family protein [Candidatus Macondimonas sp.]|nr:DNA polymerase Y family protein [Candidatus Macondimonas sp.]